MIEKILDIPFLYSLWQFPFIEQKVALFKDHAAIPALKEHTIVDLGCGPGTNYNLFREKNYYGFDLNKKYIAKARKLFPQGNFFECDVSSKELIEILNSEKIDKVDIIFINSLLHHLDDSQLEAMFSLCTNILKPGGNIHVTDLIMTDGGIPRFLALADRGDYPRSAVEWKRILSEYFKITYWEEFNLTLFNISL
jgi:SAM-dependent methyltransferase